MKTYKPKDRSMGLDKEQQSRTKEFVKIAGAKNFYKLTKLSFKISYFCCKNCQDNIRKEKNYDNLCETCKEKVKPFLEEYQKIVDKANEKLRREQE